MSLFNREREIGAESFINLQSAICNLQSAIVYCNILIAVID
ncbi:MAG TPA: hypothetical protein VKS99_17550 [Blastocatellia bacterium]|nr:hypothetical protein [Blastocatellia bacterium]